MTILEKIYSSKRDELKKTRSDRPIDIVIEQGERTYPAQDFAGILKQRSAQNGGRPALIAEVKHASPSRGDLASEIESIDLAKIYADNDASAISVLTEKQFFDGHLESLKQIADLRLGVPLLRKDFIFDPYQVYESRANGADAVLLIAAGLEIDDLASLSEIVERLGMTSLVEVHNLEELNKVLPIRPKLIGINNRNLQDFTVDLRTAFILRDYIPDDVCVVAESGIQTLDDVRKLSEAGVDAILVGEALVTALDIATKVRELAWLQ